MNTTIKSAFCFVIMSLATACGLQDESESPPAGNPPPDCGSECNSGGSDAGTGGSSSGGQSDGGTGGSTTTDAGSGGSTTTPPSGMPAPVVSNAACEMLFHDDYINGSPCGEVRGNLPGMTWSSGQFITDSNSDGRLELKYETIPEGCYQLSYLDVACKNEVPRTNWAAYGDPEMLKAMTAEARSFIQCTWWDAAAKKVKTVSDPGCNIRIKVGPGCAISGDGNMSNFE
jgi:hypothetical protein